MKELSNIQKDIMRLFYSVAPTKVVYKKSERNKLWKLASAKEEIDNFDTIQAICPALAHQIQKSYESGSNIQSAVFSECVYAQTLANMLKLDKFVNCLTAQSFVSEQVNSILKLHHMTPRYLYYSDVSSQVIVQAGGCASIDCVLISLADSKVYSIEFKESYAKVGEHDLPQYGEDGKFVDTENFLNKYPQFTAMLQKHMDLNFFDIIGHNIRDFSVDSIVMAVNGNFDTQYADVVCTEDKSGNFVMLPANHLSKWATVEGEIRSAGRNLNKVWTPTALLRFLSECDAEIVGTKVMINQSKLSLRKGRGSNGGVTGYKINQYFFVPLEQCSEENGFIKFDISQIRQLRPTISGKVNFKNLKYSDVKEYYMNEI